jgi:hypothetical protein
MFKKQMNETFGGGPMEKGWPRYHQMFFFLAGQSEHSTSPAAYPTHGKWCYLYRAIDHDGHLVDSMLSELRNHLRPRPIMGESISLSEQRRAFLDQLVALQALLQAAS